MAHMIFGVTPADPFTFFAVAAALLLVAACASVRPALRVAALDRTQTLRNE